MALKNSNQYCEEIKQKTWGGVVLNAACSLSCVFCGGRRNTSSVELKKMEINVYRNLRDFKLKELKKIDISGSDPIEYDKITELISYIKQEGFEWVQLSTHGVKLSDPVFLKKLIPSGVTQLKIPIYGSNAKIHDSITQTPGSFNKAVLGIKNLFKKTTKISIQISCLICQQNKDDLLNIVDFVKNLGVTDLYFSIPCLSKNDYSFYVPLKNLPAYARPLYDYIVKSNSKIMFLEIPFCVFGKFNTGNIDNLTLPPNLGKYNQPPGRFKISTPDLPSYRLKRKTKMCTNCKAFDYCDGFYINDINKFGIDSLRPIK